MAVRLSALRAGRAFPQEDSWYSFLLEAESTPGHGEAGTIRRIEEIQWPHRESNPRPSGKNHSAQPTTLLRAPMLSMWNLYLGPNNQL
jgi:hypothetical protein